jgi:hypothetical protein
MRPPFVGKSEQASLFLRGTRTAVTIADRQTTRVRKTQGFRSPLSTGCPTLSLVRSVRHLLSHLPRAGPKGKRAPAEDGQLCQHRYANPENVDAPQISVAADGPTLAHCRRDAFSLQSDRVDYMSVNPCVKASHCLTVDPARHSAISRALAATAHFLDLAGVGSMLLLEHGRTHQEIPHTILAEALR